MQKMSLAVLVVSKLIFPGYFVSCGRYACTFTTCVRKKCAPEGLSGCVSFVLLRDTCSVKPLYDFFPHSCMLYTFSTFTKTLLS